jgi:F-type H+-transporting ATPase subunit b
VTRLARFFAIGLVLAAPAAFAAAEGGAAESGVGIWKIANFLLLVGFLAYLIGKNAGPFFAARTHKIQEDMAQAEKMRQDAEARVGEVERRLGNLESEMAALRAESEMEAGGETERMRQQTMAEMAKIRANAEREIAAAGKAARLDLKRYSAHLAIQLAEEKVRGRVTPDTQDALVREFVRDLDRPATGRK